MTLNDLVNMDRIVLIVPVVAILVQVCKNFKQIADATSWLPLLSMALGIIASALWMCLDPPEGGVISRLIAMPVVQGVMAGLMASGLWSVPGAQQAIKPVGNLTKK